MERAGLALSPLVDGSDAQGQPCDDGRYAVALVPDDRRTCAACGPCWHRGGAVRDHAQYLLWPSRHRNPNRRGWQSETDIVAKAATAVRAAGMRFGTYYSGGLDWTFSPDRVDNIQAMFTSMPHDYVYDRYCLDHYLELIERYRPDYLWNDIGYPTEASMLEVCAAHYNANPDGLVNDRWLAARDLLGGSDADRAARMNAMFGFLKQYRVPPPAHYDVITPEYAPTAMAFEKKWEATRGIGSSFGFNRQEVDPP